MFDRGSDHIYIFKRNKLFINIYIKCAKPRTTILNNLTCYKIVLKHSKMQRDHINFFLYRNAENCWFNFIFLSTEKLHLKNILVYTKWKGQRKHQSLKLSEAPTFTLLVSNQISSINAKLIFKNRKNVQHVYILKIDWNSYINIKQNKTNNILS